MNERVRGESASRETKETKEVSAEGWTVVEGGNEETNRKAACCGFALCVEFQPRRSMRRRTKISHHEIPPLRLQEKIDIYLELLETVATAEVTAMYSVEIVAWPRGGEVGGKERRGAV